MAYHKIPASIILPPRELKHYRRWQGLYTNVRPAEQGYIPTAREYEDFKQWLQRQDSGYFSVIFEDISGHISPSSLEPTTITFEPPIASICQHAMHPVAAIQRWSRCPVCTIDMHVKYMDVLAQTLRSAGGHAPTCTLTSSDHQDIIYSAWSHGKLDTLKELSKLERMADAEIAWTSQHPDAKFDDIRTATDALDVYWSEIAGCSANVSYTKKEGAVVFAQSTDFEPGRPNPYFHKKSPRYEPGKYTVATQDDSDNDQFFDVPGGYSEATVYHFGAEEEPEYSIYDRKQDDSIQDDECVEGLEEDDGDSDWEDIHEDEDGSSYGDEVDEHGLTCSELEEETSFIVFGDD